MKHRNPAPLVHQVTFRDGSPVRPRPELSEDLPRHADMLRYDLGFHSPDDTSICIFPAFKHKTDGSYPVNLTGARWQSFGVTLTANDANLSYDYVATHPIGDWITYQRPEGSYYNGLEPMTLAAWLNAHPKVTIRGWKSI